MATVRAMHKTSLLRLERDDYLRAFRERDAMDAAGLKELAEELCEAEEGLEPDEAERERRAAKTTIAPEGSLSRSSRFPRAGAVGEELLATLLTVARYDKGERLPVPLSEADRLGINKFKQAAMLLKQQTEKKANAAGLGALDKEDGYVGVVISGEIKVTCRVSNTGGFVSERVGPGWAPQRSPRRSLVRRRCRGAAPSPWRLSPPSPSSVPSFRDPTSKLCPVHCRS